MTKKYLTVDDIKAYSKATTLSDRVWMIVSEWDWFNKRTLGIQWVNSTDSIAGNIAEGFGRYHKKDKQKFYYNARASVYESKHWCSKAQKRKLISKKMSDDLTSLLNELPRDINYQIKITQSKLKV